jgi:hypothetical protein
MLILALFPTSKARAIAVPAVFQAIALTVAFRGTSSSRRFLKARVTPFT